MASSDRAQPGAGRCRKQISLFRVALKESAVLLYNGVALWKLTTVCKHNTTFAPTFALRKKLVKSHADHQLYECAIYTYYSRPFSSMRKAIV